MLRDLRLLWAPVAACALTLAGCGSNGGFDGTILNDQDGGTHPFDATSPGSLLGDANAGSDEGGSGGNPSCTPRTCALAGATCGPVADGCGGLLQCGDCTAPQTCGGGGTPSVCGGTAACVPATCTSLGVTCGQQGDGCGNTFDCGACVAPQTCGGGGTPSVCGGTAGCVPLLASAACSPGMNCGAVADGCGGLVYCGSDDAGACPSGTTCGGGGQPNQCGGADLLPDGGVVDSGPSCTPIPRAAACAGLLPDGGPDAGSVCGLASDGCGDTYDCGSCAPPATCGGGGTPSACGGAAACVPQTACPVGMNCGAVTDGCGGVVYCGTGDAGACPTNELCGGGGNPNVCGARNVLPDGAVVDGGLDLCTPLAPSAACAGLTCGVVSDLCGGTIPCGTCTAPQTCGGGLAGAAPDGGGSIPNVCGGVAACIPKTTCPSGMNCGFVADGCGGAIGCGGVDGGACPTGELCGGGGSPNVCGAKNILPDGGVVDGGLSLCSPTPQGTACAAAFHDGGSGDAGVICGQTGDGCGNVYTCGTCTSPATCGGGGTPFECGEPACVPVTTCPAGVCGTIANGCGGTVTCATCTLPETCGGGGTAYQCGQPSCKQLTTCPSNVKCGPAADGCGGTIVGDGGTTLSCGMCVLPETCGGGGTASQCGEPACKPITACPPPANCGTWPDGCGGTITCGTNDAGTCPPGEVCGGSGVPSVCGGGLPDGGVGCDAGLKCDLDECDSGSPTVLKGQIFDPAGLNPLYNVVIYVPNATPAALVHGQPSCESCSSLYTGDPIVAATTDTDGNFTLTGVPVPASGQVPIVIQVGKWRRQWVWPAVSKCSTNTATTADEKFLRLPGLETTTAPSTTVTLDDLPEIAVSTGHADSMECLFQRIGFNDSEYVCGGATTGHLHVFQGGSSSSTHGKTVSGCSAESSASLWDTDDDINAYDIVILSCEGAETASAVPSVLHDFAQVGGRAFASHYHYSWFSGPIQTTQTYTAPSDWGSNLGTWVGSSNDIDDNANKNELNALIVATISDGGTPFRTWLGNVNALGTGATTPSNELYIDAPRYNVAVTSSNTPSQVWILPDDAGYTYKDKSGNHDPVPSNATQYFSFNTPIGGTGDASAPYCGRIVYSDFHIGSGEGDYTGSLGTSVPSGCETGPLSPQEKALEYMLLDLASCVGSDTNLPSGPVCAPQASCPPSYACGTYPNGCGTGDIACGPGCDGGVCVSNAGIDGGEGTSCVACVPEKTCAPGSCGDFPDGCGGILQCGGCEAGTCINGTCETGCVKQTCASQGITCGPAGDGCGGVLDCWPTDAGTCPVAGEACVTLGDGGVGCSPPCNKISCASLGLHCGPAGDGCGGTQQCGNCTTPGNTCGGGGTPGVCGEGDANLCVPLTCAGQGIECGPAGDGCGDLIASCGPCPTGTTCGGGGTPGKCGAPNCTPIGCGSLHCGSTGNGCGGVISCGTCTAPATCGGGGTPGVCGLGDANVCAPLGCPPTITCGETGDGCGNIINCGTCDAGTCGGGGTPGVCGAPTCTPIGCGSLHCGSTGDGCGGTITCGTCAAPATCGGGGTPGVCGEADANVCQPLACPPSITCGETGDGCGNLITCGTCTPPLTCGGGGVAGACGAPDCTPKTCAEIGATCGQVADGCGGLTADCGTCTGSATCGGGGTANQCGSPDCTPRTCAQAGANCGPVADGCGGIVQCGTCTAPDTCGGGGITSVCGTGNVK